MLCRKRVSQDALAPSFNLLLLFQISFMQQAFLVRRSLVLAHRQEGAAELGRLFLKRKQKKKRLFCAEIWADVSVQGVITVHITLRGGGGKMQRARGIHISCITKLMELLHIVADRH